MKPFYLRRTLGGKKEQAVPPERTQKAKFSTALLLFTLVLLAAQGFALAWLLAFLNG